MLGDYEPLVVQITVDWSAKTCKLFGAAVVLVIEESCSRKRKVRIPRMSEEKRIRLCNGLVRWDMGKPRQVFV